MINDNGDNDAKQGERDDKNENNDDIDELIGTVMNEKGFDLKCPNRIDNEPCPAILRVTKKLILYKRWLNTIYTKSKAKDNIDNTVDVDLKSNIDSST